MQVPKTVKTKQTESANIDEYIAGFPSPVRDILEKIRVTIRNAAPGAEEAIKYQMPAFVLNGNLVFFGAFKKHIGFYPGARAIRQFRKELSVYKSSTGSVQLPLEKPIPLDLIKRMVKFRGKENLKKAAN